MLDAAKLKRKPLQKWGYHTAGTNSANWVNLTAVGAWCYYENKTANGTVYGKLYNWYAVHDPRGLAPAGCHIPSDPEWTTLTASLGGDTLAGGAMKNTTGWPPPNTGATNSSGFSGLPGGRRNESGSFYDGSFIGFWWSFTKTSNNEAWYRSLLYSGMGVTTSRTSVDVGFSVRCIRD